MTRFLGIALIAALWLGAALLLAAVVAPAAFEVLPSRTIAGTLVGRVLPVVFIAGCLGGVATLVLGAPGSGLGSGGRASAVVWAAACAAAQFIVSPRIERVREAAGPIDALAPDSPLRVAFGRLHGVSVGLLGLGMLAALGVLVLSARAVGQRG